MMTLHHTRYGEPGSDEVLLMSRVNNICQKNVFANDGNMQSTWLDHTPYSDVGVCDTCEV
jgi:hypothetical protein